MPVLRSIFAALFAILIANPACCCSVMPPAPAEHGCCGSPAKEGEKEPAQLCACDPQIQASDQDRALPPVHSQSAPPPPLAIAPRERLQPEQPALPALSLFTDTGPPRLRLAVLQRFLI